MNNVAYPRKQRCERLESHQYRKNTQRFEVAEDEGFQGFD